jgi:predicted metal-binding membrane protein
VSQRASVLAGLAGVVALSWTWLIAASRDMYGSMQGLSAWMMAATWNLRYAVLIFAMWVAMMVGMMLPSATPAILLYGRVLRTSPQVEAPVARTYAFVAGYLLAWAAFSLAATILQYGLASAALLSPMMVSASPKLGAAILLAAGLYQLTPMKRACLAHCRGAADFITRHFRPGVGGALRMGAHHGLYCVGCCWALMLLLFFGGVMSLAWIAAITIFVLLEKLLPFAAQTGKVSGALLIGAGVLLPWLESG